jgi:hypothetical protein
LYLGISRRFSSIVGRSKSHTATAERHVSCGVNCRGATQHRCHEQSARYT